MNGPRNRQRGAVTLIGALFMIVVLAALAQTINSMSASGLIDAAVQSDAVEALFIAESGIEYASALYAAGTACSGLAAIGDTALGRGSFAVTGAFPVGGDCRIQVEAAIDPLAAGATPARRTLIADLRLSGGEGWAVGDNGSILRWDGGSWNSVTSGTSQDLYGVHCVSASDCWAVGDNSTILHWNGSAWSAWSAISNRHLRSVSCSPLTSNACNAVGYQWLFVFLGRALHWNGNIWSDTGGLQLFDYYNDVSCPSTNCFGVLEGGSIRQSASSWGMVFSGATTLNGVDCPDTDQCWAVGDLSGDDYYFVRNNGGSWSLLTVPAPNQARSNLNAVSCSAVDDCWAVGDADNSRYVVVHWDGSGWTEFAFQNGQHRENLNAVHCASAGDCWAVGDQRNGWNLIRYDGSGWSYVGSAASGTQDLNDVFLTGNGGGGSVSLVRWQEPVAN